MNESVGVRLKWISVKDRLPDKFLKCWTYGNHYKHCYEKYVKQSYFSEGDFYDGPEGLSTAKDFIDKNWQV